MKGSGRLVRVERTLSPQQAVLHWLVPLLGAKTPAAWSVARWRADDRLWTMLQQVKASAIAQAVGDRDAREAVGRAAGREGFFLSRLADRINQSAVSNWEAWTLRTLVLATEPSRLALAWPRPGEWEERTWEELGRLGGFLIQSAQVFTATRQAHEIISREYFAGQPVLFAGAREELALAESVLERAARFWSDWTTVRWEGCEPTMVDELAQLWLGQARLDTWQAGGEEAKVTASLDRMATRLEAEESANGGEER